MEANDRVRSYFDVGPGDIFCLDFIDPDKSLGRQLNILREDMGWISFWNGTYTIDFGWTPDHDEDGSFKTYLIKEDNWDNPILKLESTDIKGFIDSINKCISIIKMETDNFKEFPPYRPPFKWS